MENNNEPQMSREEFIRRNSLENRVQGGTPDAPTQQETTQAVRQHNRQAKEANQKKYLNVNTSSGTSRRIPKRVFACPTPDPTSAAQVAMASQPGRGGASRLTEMQRRTADLYEMVEAHALNRRPESARVRQVLLNNLNRAGELTGAFTLRAGNADRINEFLARTFAVKRKYLGMGSDYTPSGRVRENINRAGTLWKGSIHSDLHKMGVVDVMRRASAEYESIFNRYKLTAAQRASIVLDAGESGWYRHIRDRADISAAAKNNLVERSTRLSDRLIRQFGMTPEDAALVLRTGQSVADGWNNAYQIARRAGASFKQQELIGYQYRAFDPTFQQRLTWRRSKDPGMGELFEFDDGTTMSGAEVINRSRSTYRWAVEDEALFDYYITENSRRRLGDPTEAYRRALGIEDKNIVPTFADVIEDGHALRRLLNDREFLSDNVLDSMMEMGLVQKLPMFTTDIAEDIIRRYKLPVEGLNELLITDPAAMLEAWTRQLDVVMKSTGQINFMLRQVIDQKWGVPKSVFDADPQKYRQYVPLVSRGQNSVGVLNQSLAERSGVFALGAGDAGTVGLFSNYYVHPVAANAIRAVIDVSRSPEYLVKVGEFMMGLNRHFRDLIVVTSNFIQRQFINSTFQVAAGGGNPLRIFEDGIRALEHYVKGKPIWEAYSTVPKYAGGLSDQDVVRRLFEIEFIHTFEPLTGERIGQTGRRVSRGTLATIRDGERWGRYALEEFGDWGQWLKENTRVNVFSVAKNKTVGFWQTMNNAADVIGRISAVLSTMRLQNARGVDPSFFATNVSGTGRRFNTLDEAVDHWKDYFPYYNDFSKVDEGLRQIVPFWGFHGRNIPAAIRHAIRNPGKYAAVSRAISIHNQVQMEEFPDDLNESTVPGYIAYSRPLFFRVNGSDGKPRWFSIGLTSLDPFSGAYEGISTSAEAIFGAMGIWQDDYSADPTQAARRTRGSTTDRLANSPVGQRPKSPLLELIAGNLFPQYEAAAQLIAAGSASANRERQEVVQPPHTFWGVEMPEIVESLITVFLPPAATINRVNPRIGGRRIFGERDYVDSNTGEFVEGYASPITGSVRTDIDAFNRALDAGGAVAGILRAGDVIGVRVTPIDVVANAGYTMQEIGTHIRASKDVYRAYARNSLRYPPGTPQHQDALNGMLAVEAYLPELEKAYEDMIAWGERRGIDPTELSRLLREGQMRPHMMVDENGVETVEHYGRQMREVLRQEIEALENDDN